MSKVQYCMKLSVLILSLFFCGAFVNSCGISPKMGEGFRDLSYGQHKKQKLDVYTPKGATDAPLIFMVHGGAWRAGDKSNRSVVKNKVNRWVGKGFVFVSTGYRLLPDSDPLVQAEDVAAALAFVQRNARSWGADPEKIVLMGHSAGAHLVSLLNSDFSFAERYGAEPWLGAVSIDTAVFDIEKLMESDPARFYRKAFGKDPQYWREVSPLYRLTEKQSPLLVICSTRRGDKPCDEAVGYVQKAHALGMRVETLPVALSHGKTNSELGLDNHYTRQVEAFLQHLDPVFQQQLRGN